MSGIDLVQSSVQQLERSETGGQAMVELLAFLDGAGLSLDQHGKASAMVLLSAAWDGLPERVRDLMREAIK